MKYWPSIRSTLPIYLSMNGLSLIFVVSSLRGFGHSGEDFVSVVGLILNILGYLLLSFILLQRKSERDVLFSLACVSGLGLCLWALILFTNQLSLLFIVYHASGYLSSLALMDWGGDSLLTWGFLLSVLPAVLIYIGYKWSRYGKRRASAVLVFSNLLFSIIFVFVTGFIGNEIKSREEWNTAFPMETGWPIRFSELRFPSIDPPLPYRYSGSCCSFYLESWSSYLFSGLIIFTITISLTVLMRNVILKVRQKGEEA
ncbi:hypothetical protein EQV77_04525 [Halobacillus fulvus]|nr:hypothetical protein EQV77_04525 [Halobacillus fulvus]